MKYERVEIEVIEIPDGTFSDDPTYFRSCMGLPDGIAEPWDEARLPLDGIGSAEKA